VARLSRFNFAPALKRSTGRNAYVYVRAVRLKRAKFLLVKISVPVSLVAIEDAVLATRTGCGGDESRGDFA
jgi:AraC-like DNA-binding protein